MNRPHSARAALAALAGMTAWTGAACAPAAWPDLGTYDPQDCAEDALRRHPDPELAQEAAVHSAARCRSGDVAACSMLGVIHELGLGARRDPARARSLYRYACEARNLRACGNLGELLLFGFGSGDSLSGAVALLRAGCEAGHARPCGVLGQLYAGAAVVPRAPAEAVWWSERACTRGDAPSCMRLVDLGADPARRSALLTKACVLGDEEACARLSRRAPLRQVEALATGGHVPR